jgi:hypothetical protein
MTLVRDDLGRPQFLIYIYKAIHLTVYEIKDLKGNLIARYTVVS